MILKMMAATVMAVGVSALIGCEPCPDPHEAIYGPLDAVPPGDLGMHPDTIRERIEYYHSGSPSARHEFSGDRMVRSTWYTLEGEILWVTDWSADGIGTGLHVDLETGGIVLMYPCFNFTQAGPSFRFDPPLMVAPDWEYSERRPSDYALAPPLEAPDTP